MFLGAVSMMVVTSPQLSLYVVGAIPILVLPLVAFGRDVRRRARLAQDRLADATAYANENIQAVRTMQAFTAEALVTRRFGAAAEEAYLSARGANRARAVLTAVIIFFVFASIVGVLWAVIGYSLSFAAGNSWIGDTSRFLLKGVGLEAQGTIPHLLFMCYQGTFCIITAALISGAIVERMNFPAYIA